MVFYSAGRLPLFAAGVLPLRCRDRQGCAAAVLAAAGGLRPIVGDQAITATSAAALSSPAR
ncbi:MAG: hypothetical protein ACLUCF_06430 [Bifidobacterium breve]